MKIDDYSIYVHISKNEQIIKYTSLENYIEINANVYYSAEIIYPLQEKSALLTYQNKQNNFQCSYSLWDQEQNSFLSKNINKKQNFNDLRTPFFKFIFPDIIKNKNKFQNNFIVRLNNIYQRQL